MMARVEEISILSWTHCHEGRKMIELDILLN